MKTTVFRTVLISTAFAFSLFSCVTQEKYNHAQDLQGQYYDEARLCGEQLTAANENIRDLERQVKILSAQKEKMSDDTLRLVQELARVHENCGLMQQQNEALMKKLQTAKTAEEAAAMMQEIQSLQNELIKREDALFKAERKLADNQKELEIQNARVTELTALLDSMEHGMSNLKNTLKNVLTDYEGLEVSSRNGRVYVSMDEKLLFKTGRWDVDGKGVAAIRDLATILAAHNKIGIIVEGHTDDIPYSGSGNITDNWDLSTKRATAIVRILLENPGIEPSRVSASGRAEFCPLDSADTAAARRKNRRSEIILTPDMQQFMKIIE